MTAKNDNKTVTNWQVLQCSYFGTQSRNKMAAE